MKELTLLLGSNLGDRRAYIDAALAALDKALGGRRTKTTQIIETEACGFEAPPFLNAAAVYLSARKPATILKICKKIERSLGRTDAPEYSPDGSRIYHNRTIDIDILKYGDTVMNTPSLTIPHPQIVSRPFVKELLAQLDTA